MFRDRWIGLAQHFTSASKGLKEAVQNTFTELTPAKLHRHIERLYILFCAVKIVMYLV
jgi:hypothetical protein